MAMSSFEDEEKTQDKIISRKGAFGAVEDGSGQKGKP